MKDKAKTKLVPSPGQRFIPFAVLIPKLGYRWLKINEVSQWLDVHPDTVRRHYTDGSLEYLKLDNGAIRFTVAQVQSFVAGWRARALARLGIALQHDPDEITIPAPARGLVKVSDVMKYFRLSRNPITHLAEMGLIDILESETGTKRCSIAQVLAYETQCAQRAQEGKCHGLLGHHKVPTRKRR